MVKTSRPANIFLTGFMGAGKSTVGRMLAKEAGYGFADLDRLIVEREGMSIPEIFARYGEDYFRDCETAALESRKGSAGMVFATGGGIVGRKENRSLMREMGVVVYLQASWPVLQERIGQGKGRPLADPEAGWEPVRLLWEGRRSWYEEADLIIDTDRLKSRGVVVEIVTKLGLAGRSGC